jgi:hypothetical protein
MKYLKKKKDKKKASFEVLRAVSRLNSHKRKISSESIVWDGRAIINSSVTS